jgi:hypothetical protein
MILLVWYLLYLNINKIQVIINILKNTKQTKQKISYEYKIKQNLSLNI